jgi:hypothetical protein
MLIDNIIFFVTLCISESYIEILIMWFKVMLYYYDVGIVFMFYYYEWLVYQYCNLFYIAHIC